MFYEPCHRLPVQSPSGYKTGPPLWSIFLKGRTQNSLTALFVKGGRGLPRGNQSFNLQILSEASSKKTDQNDSFNFTHVPKQKHKKERNRPYLVPGFYPKSLFTAKSHLRTVRLGSTWNAPDLGESVKSPRRPERIVHLDQKASPALQYAKPATVPRLLQHRPSSGHHQPLASPLLPAPHTEAPQTQSNQDIAKQKQEQNKRHNPSRRQRENKVFLSPGERIMRD